MYRKIAIGIMLAVYIGVVEILAVGVYIHLKDGLDTPAPEGTEWYLRILLYVILPLMFFLFIRVAGPVQRSKDEVN